MRCPIARAAMPTLARADAPVNIDYEDDARRLERIVWVEGLVCDLPPPANQAKLHSYIQRLLTIRCESAK